MKKRKSTTIIQILLIIAIISFIGLFIYDVYTSKVDEKKSAEIISELDKIIEENKKLTDEERQALENEEEITRINDEDDNLNGNETRNNISKNTSVNSNKKYNTLTQSTLTKSAAVKIENYTVYGKIEIEKIGIEYPIIKYEDEDSLWKSICKVSENKINGTGNLCLAGHNMRNATMFAKIKKLKNGDKIKITNIYGDTYVYTVYDAFYVNPNDVDVLNPTEEPILTLITCNNTGSKRLIVKAKI